MKSGADRQHIVRAAPDECDGARPLGSVSPKTLEGRACGHPPGSGTKAKRTREGVGTQLTIDGYEIVREVSRSSLHELGGQRAFARAGSARKKNHAAINLHGTRMQEGERRRSCGSDGLQPAFHKAAQTESRPPEVQNGTIVLNHLDLAA